MLKKIKVFIRTDLSLSPLTFDVLKELEALGVFVNGEIVYDDEDAELSQKISEIFDKINESKKNQTKKEYHLLIKVLLGHQWDVSFGKFWDELKRLNCICEDKFLCLDEEQKCKVMEFAKQYKIEIQLIDSEVFQKQTNQ